ncbi:MAG TPA: guanylate kinase [Acidimicrobiia bacterium]|nr:guanylate kinase [Acidimicrobiia bacterium]
MISGPSGVGKSTVIERLRERLPFHFSVSVTTRRPRKGERNGVDYYFVSRVEFDRLLEKGELLESAEYSGRSYGTPRGPVIARLERGEHVLLDIENRGAMQVKRNYPDAITIFLAPPSRQELERRLRSRRDTDEADIQARLEVAGWQEEMARVEFDHLVVNDEVGRVVDEIVRIIDNPSH